MSTWSSEQMVCASCRYWMGKRSINFTGDFYNTDEYNGACANPYGGFRGCSMDEGASCSDWKCFK